MSERDYENDPTEDPDYQPDDPYVAPPPPYRAPDDPYYTQPQQPGIGTPDSGYGWGGVDNPAYNPVAPPPNTDTPPVVTDGPRPTSPPPPTNTGGVPSVGGSAPGINVPGAGLPQHILDLFNRVPQQTPIQAAYQDALLKFMNRAQTTPTLDDSILGPQTEVYRAAQQRGQERSRRNVAERAAANGQSESGFLDTQINQGVQQQNFNTASFNSNLLGGEFNKRREELQAGMQLASATGNAEAARELQARLAQVSAAMQQQGLNLQGQLGAGDLALRWGLGTENLNQQALQIIMGGIG